MAEDRQTYRSFRITDFTSHPRIAEFPDSNAGSIESPPTLPFGQYVLRVLLSGKYASEKTEYKAGDFVLLQNVRVNGKGGRGLEGYIASESCSAYPIKVIKSPASELGPLLLCVSSPFPFYEFGMNERLRSVPLRQRARFYSRRQQKLTPAPEEEREVLTIASPITHVADDGGDVSMETPQEGPEGGLDSIPKSRAPTPDRFSLLKDAKVNTVLDGLFQVRLLYSLTILASLKLTSQASSTSDRPSSLLEQGRYVLRSDRLDSSCSHNRASSTPARPRRGQRPRAVRSVRPRGAHPASAPAEGLRVPRCARAGRHRAVAGAEARQESAVWTEGPSASDEQLWLVKGQGGQCRSSRLEPPSVRPSLTSGSYFHATDMPSVLQSDDERLRTN